jgi:Acetyltransferase (GNAT) domain/Acetyltransferase (GNAT) family
MSDINFEIRLMTPSEVGIAIEWAAAEGWNPGLYDAQCFYRADPLGFLIGLLEGVPIAIISAVKYSSTFGFIGFYIVKPQYRGHSYGPLIGKAALAYLEGCNVGLDGVVEKQSNYQSLGFNMAYRNIRYQGLGGGAFPANNAIVNLESIPFEELCKYDKLFFPALRNDFLKCWIEQPQSAALGILDDGKIAGYGVIRTCSSGFKIGPLFADTPEYAELLFLALKSFAPKESPVFLDVPEINSDALALATRHKMTISFETARMYTGPFPDLPLDRLYGVTSFEIG